VYNFDCSKHSNLKSVRGKLGGREEGEEGGGGREEGEGGREEGRK